MIIDLPATTTREINRRLVDLREEGGAVALGRVLTLVVDAGDHDPEDAIAAANVASHEHPCRVVVLTTGADLPGALDAQIRLGGDAGASEVVVLRFGREVAEHLDTLVLPLLLPDAPVVAWWPYRVPDDPARHPVGALAQRRITDSTRCADPRGALRRLAATHAPGDTDLAWTRITLWRGLLAAMLQDSPDGPVTSAVVEGRDAHSSTDLMAAWLGYALGCPVRVRRSPDSNGLTRVALHRDSGDIVVERPDGKTAALLQPGQPEHRIALPLRSLPECLAEELRRLDDDEVYGETLRHGLERIEP